MWGHGWWVRRSSVWRNIPCAKSIARRVVRCCGLSEQMAKCAQRGGDRLRMGCGIHRVHYEDCAWCDLLKVWNILATIMLFWPSPYRHFLLPVLQCFEKDHRRKMQKFYTLYGCLCHVVAKATPWVTGVWTQGCGWGDGLAANAHFSTVCRTGVYQTHLRGFVSDWTR